MIRVFDWIGTKEPPQSVTINDMRYGIGCMNEMTVITADLFKKLTISLHDGSDKAETLNMIKDMDKETLGGLWKHFREYYDGDMLSQEKVKHAIDERNYFIHEYHNANPKKEDGKRMFDLIRLLITVNNQLNNVMNKVDKECSKKQNEKKNSNRQVIIEIVHSCNQFQPGCVYLTELGNALRQKNIELDEKLSVKISKFGWKMYYHEGHETLLFVKIDEIC